MEIQVIGSHWGAYLARGSFLSIEEPTAATVYIAPFGPEVGRLYIQDWLDTHAGDFSEVMDFAALPTIEWAREESEFFFLACMYPEFEVE